MSGCTRTYRRSTQSCSALTSSYRLGSYQLTKVNIGNSQSENVTVVSYRLGSYQLTKVNTDISQSEPTTVYSSYRPGSYQLTKVNTDISQSEPTTVVFGAGTYLRNIVNPNPNCTCGHACPHPKILQLN